MPPLPREVRLKVIAKTVQETPFNATHWSRSLMAEAVGISPSSVGRIWAEAGLKPHLTTGFKVSNDVRLRGGPSFGLEARDGRVSELVEIVWRRNLRVNKHPPNRRQQPPGRSRHEAEYRHLILFATARRTGI